MARVDELTAPLADLVVVPIRRAADLGRVREHAPAEAVRSFVDHELRREPGIRQRERGGEAGDATAHDGNARPGGWSCFGETRQSERGGASSGGGEEAAP